MNQARAKPGGMVIDPSGRPVERAGFEAVFAIGLILVWVFIMGGVFALMAGDMAGAGAWPSFALAGLCGLCWAYAEVVAGRWHLIWPASALGVVGPLSLGFAVALATPELRTGPHMLRLAIISGVAGVAMIPFMFRFRLPGLVSPIITFSLVGMFLGVYGADVNRIKEMEGFSPRGIVAALMDQPLAIGVFGVLGLVAMVMARRLDMKGENFALASARPLHLVGAGVVVLVAGRLLAMLPHPADLIALSALWIACIVWTMRINRVAVMFATHFAMAKPLKNAIVEPLGVELTLEQWSTILGAVLLFDILIWPFLHVLSQRIGWTLGPGGRVPPDRPGVMWRYWPYATESSLDRWAERKARRREERQARRERRQKRREASRTRP